MTESENQIKPEYSFQYKNTSADYDSVLYLWKGTDIVSSYFFKTAPTEDEVIEQRGKMLGIIRNDKMQRDRIEKLNKRISILDIDL